MNCILLVILIIFLILLYQTNNFTDNFTNTNNIPKNIYMCHKKLDHIKKYSEN